MARDEVELVRGIFDALRSRDPAGLAALSEDVDFVNHAGPESASGRERVAEWFESASAALRRYELEPTRLLSAGGGRVVAEVREMQVGLSSGIASERVAGSVFTVRDGQISRIEAFPTAHEALVAVGLAGLGMSNENEDAGLRFLDAYQDGDISRLLDVCDPDVEIQGRLTVEQLYRGHDGVRQWHRDRVDAWELFDVEHERMIVVNADSLVWLFIIHALGRTSRIELHEPVAAVATFRGGKLIRGTVFIDRREAFAAAGLSEG